MDPPPPGFISNKSANISTLPDLCLLKIFALLPFRDQACLHRICKRWSCLQPSVTCKRRTLILTLANRSAAAFRQTATDAIPYKDDLVRDPEELNLLNLTTRVEPDLEFPNFHRQIAHFVSVLFPQLTSLVFYIDAIKPSDIDNIITFLETVQSSLKSLKLFFRGLAYESTPSGSVTHSKGITKLNAPFLHKLIRFINDPTKFQGLKQLTLGINDHLFPEARFTNSKEQLDFPILGRLEEFYFVTNERNNVLWKSLQRFANETPFQEDLSHTESPLKSTGPSRSIPIPNKVTPKTLSVIKGGKDFFCGNPFAPLVDNFMNGNARPSTSKYTPDISPSLGDRFNWEKSYGTKVSSASTESDKSITDDEPEQSDKSRDKESNPVKSECENSPSETAPVIPTLRRIGVANAINSDAHMEQYLSLPSNAANRFTYLTINYMSISGPQLSKFCDLFSNLTTLLLNIGELSLSEWTTSLAKLSCLVHLRLWFEFDYHLRFPLSLEVYTGENRHLIGRLSSVQVVTLQPSFNSHTELECYYWGRVFPSVQVLRIYRSSDQCSECQFQDLSLVDHERLHNCARLMMLQWKNQCEHIHTFQSICPGDDVKQWARDELTWV